MSDCRAGRLYDLCLDLSLKKRAWFGLSDCCYRFLLVVLSFYWAALTSPIDLLQFTMSYNTEWYGRRYGGLTLVGLSLPNYFI